LPAEDEVAEILARVSDLLRMNGSLVLARVVSGTGSTPRDAGARMVILKGGKSEGTIGGGLVEAETMKTSARLFEERCSTLFAVDMTADDAAGTDMICGGKMEIFCEYVEAGDEAVHTFDRIASDQRNYRKNILCTVLEKHPAGIKTINRFLLHQSDVHDEAPVSPLLLNALKETAGSLSGSALHTIDGRLFCLDVVESMESLYIFGAGHVAKEVAGLASHVGFRVMVLDDRGEFANKQRFPGPVEARVLESFAGCTSSIMLDSDSYAVIVTRGHVHDKTVLDQILRTGAGYIGMIGSVRKRDTIFKALLSEGFTGEDLQRVHCPIGIPIDTESPEEIAVSIVGELIHTRTQKRRRLQ
jgi:xanthine dehydrogenase accessory factor